jgi:hypothetical protein
MHNIPDGILVLQSPYTAYFGRICIVHPPDGVHTPYYPVKVFQGNPDYSKEVFQSTRDYSKELFQSTPDYSKKVIKSSPDYSARGGPSSHCPCRILRRRCAARRPWRRAGGPDDPLLVADRRLAARHHRPPLSPRRFLARGGLLSADLHTPRHRGFPARRRLVRVPLGPALPCRRRRHRPGSSGAGRAPPSPPPTITFSLVGGS